MEFPPSLTKRPPAPCVSDARHYLTCWGLLHYCMLGAAAAWQAPPRTSTLDQIRTRPGELRLLGAQAGESGHGHSGHHGNPA
eukprot:15441523-Alexandrium_andersonii.AAC.1